MHRTHSSKPYDILHGINFSTNTSSIFAYLSYFPPPPPIIPGPPPQRSWTCSAHSLLSTSCFVSDDLNPPGLRTLIPIVGKNQSSSIKNISLIDEPTHQNSKIPPILQFLQNQITVILLLIILLSILIFIILFFLLFLYIHRIRQRQLLSNSHAETDDNNNNNNNNNLELNNNNNNKNKKFYYHLIPYREKREKRTMPLRTIHDENKLLRSKHHDSPVLEAIPLTKTCGLHINDNDEQEEAL
ncbi:unnamed protein product [Adineta steineri]|uniref:Uncharacterized protein n=1 Tax=Adineta steineri TaxID=433720 RepID=A0A813YDJ7_9BILA|nr:unnamed protein product [Adineta steineri]